MLTGKGRGACSKAVADLTERNVEGKVPHARHLVLDESVDPSFCLGSLFISQDPLLMRLRLLVPPIA
jgi:hypothetical protein